MDIYYTENDSYTSNPYIELPNYIKIAMSDTDPLRTLYKSLSGKGGLPLEPTDPYYVPILGDTPEKDPILALEQRIDLAESESLNLLTGFRGNGKSTELRRLKERLEKNGCQVFLVDMLDYVLMTKPLELSDFILSLMAALAAAVEGSSDENLKPLSQSYWHRLSDFLRSEIEIEKIDLGLKGAGSAVGLGMKLKTDPNFKVRVQEHLQGHLTRLVQDAREFIDELVVAIRKQTGDQDKKVVLLVDSLEQLRGSGDDAEKIHASVVELFSGQSVNLHFPKLHVVYTVPPYLTTLAHNLGRSLGGNPITRWPNIHVRTKAGAQDREGLEVMTAIIDKRMISWREHIPESMLRHLAASSGGDIRDFFRLIRECILSLRTARLARPESQLSDAIVDRVLQQLLNELLPIADEDAIWLARIHETKREALTSDKDLPSLARFLDSNLIMNYLNGEPWYDIHPLLIEEIKRRRIADKNQEQ